MEVTLADNRELSDVGRRYQQNLLDIFLKLALPQPHKWQWEVLYYLTRSIALHEQFKENNYLVQDLIFGAYGPGKTTGCIFALMLLMLWAEARYPNRKLKGAVISGSEDQLYSVFWSDLNYLVQTTRAKEYFNINYNEFSLKSSPFYSVDPRVANMSNIHSLAGLHGDIVIVVLEEASAIHREVYHKIQTFFTNCIGFLLMTGNPVRRDSILYDIGEGETTTWNKYRVGRVDVAPDNDLSKDPYSVRVAEEYGIDSDQYRINVLGYHGLEETDSFIPDYVTTSALERPFVTSYGHLRMAVDVSTGGASDPSAIWMMTNNTVKDVFRHKITEPDLRCEVVHWIDQRGVTEVMVDEVGCGLGLFEFLKNRYYGSGVKIFGVNGGKRAADNTRFGNCKTELGWRARSWMHNHGHIPKDMPHLSRFLEECRMLRASVNNSGVYMLESKKNLPSSTDLFDACSYCFLNWSIHDALHGPSARPSSGITPIYRPGIQQFNHYGNPIKRQI